MYLVWEPNRGTRMYYQAERDMRLIETEIQGLKNKVLDMAELVLLQLDQTVLAFTNLDYELADKIRKKDKKINKYDTKIDKSCERIIALYQPVASDLRFIFSTLKINTFLEQIGDIINSIARKILNIGMAFDAQFLESLRLGRMLVLTRSILADSLGSFFHRDQELSLSIFPKDDQIDEIHEEAFHQIVTRIQERTDHTEAYMQLYFIIKNLEKIADFAVCIAEEALFNLNGVVYKHTKLKYAYRNESQQMLPN